MVEKVEDPLSDAMLNAEEFIEKYGNDHDGHGYYAICPESPLDSPHRLKIDAKSSVNVATHFRHHQETECFAKIPDRISNMLKPRGHDVARGRIIYSEFCKEENLQEAFNVCHKILTHLNADGFLTLCERANGRNIWNYAGIELWAVPYLLATLADIPIERTKKDGGQVSYTMRATLHKPRGETVDAAWERPRQCKLKIKFVKSDGTVGQEMIHSPVFIPDERIEARRSITNWMSRGLIERIQECCEQHR